MAKSIASFFFCILLFSCSVQNAKGRLLANRKAQNTDVMERFNAGKERMRRQSDIIIDENPDPVAESDFYIDLLFWRYNNLDYRTMKMANFTKLLGAMGLDGMTPDHDDDHEHGEDHDHEHGHENDHEHEHGHESRKHSVWDLHGLPGPGNGRNIVDCTPVESLLTSYGYDSDTKAITSEMFKNLCPALVDHLVRGSCSGDDHDHHHHDDDKNKGRNMGLVWLYMMILVTLISLCAVWGILFIPKKTRKVYMRVIQFLIALAAGTMAGDGLIHLLPHAMMPAHDHGNEGHDHGHHDEHDDHDDHEAAHMDAMLKGLTAIIGVYAFFFLERFFAIYKTLKERKQKQKREGAVNMKMLPEVDEMNGASHHIPHDDDDENSRKCKCPTMTPLALMIILGDLFHNFCDGLAIGAGFAASTTIGLSTSIAVFCHELPHEIGDFAVLIQSGLSKKEAVVLNFISALSCYVGAVIGIFLGDFGNAPMWIFAGVGGMFLYIALVDLVPEMTKVYLTDNESWPVYLGLHALGLILGAILMVVLGIYEHDIATALD